MCVRGAGVGRRTRDDGGLLKALSESLSDGLSTKHSCFRPSWGSGGSSGPFYLHMVFLRSRPSGALALFHTPLHLLHIAPSLSLSLLAFVVISSVYHLNSWVVLVSLHHTWINLKYECPELSFSLLVTLKNTFFLYSFSCSVCMFAGIHTGRKYCICFLYTWCDSK